MILNEKKEAQLIVQCEKGKRAQLAVVQLIEDYCRQLTTPTSFPYCFSSCLLHTNYSTRSSPHYAMSLAQQFQIRIPKHRPSWRRLSWNSFPDKSKNDTI